MGDSKESNPNLTDIKPGTGTVRVDSPHSTDESVRQDGRVNVSNQATVTGERTKTWFTNVLLALNILVMAVLIFVYRNAGMVQDLKRYDLDFFVQHDFASLKTQVQTDHDLIQAYGLQKTISSTLKQEH